MQEAEVCLRIAMYFIKQGITEEDVQVSLDGAHIKTKEQIHFDIFDFMKKENIIKVDGNSESWRGVYRIMGYEPRIIIGSKSGEGDIRIIIQDGKNLYVECKKDRKNSMHALMREAIGQLMAPTELVEGVVLVVGVPYTEQTYTLASKWAEYPQIKNAGIKFMLVHESGELTII